jgi:hypothetical protein
MYYYGIIYLGLAIKLFFDSKEQKKISGLELFLTALVLSLLSLWRREGICLILLSVPVLKVCYTKINLKKIILVFVVTEMLLGIPVYISETNMEIPEKNHTFSAYIVHMMNEKSFDYDKCQEELKIIDKWLDINQINSYNEVYGDNYGDTYWEWSDFEEGAYYVPKVCTKEEEYAAKVAIIKVVFKEPIVFLKSRVGALSYLNKSYISIYNIFFPIFICLLLMLVGVVRKEWSLFVLMFSILAQTALIVLTMPASYYKYFLVVVYCGYVFGAIFFIKNRLV